LADFPTNNTLWLNSRFHDYDRNEDFPYIPGIPVEDTAIPPILSQNAVFEATMQSDQYPKMFKHKGIWLASNMQRHKRVCSTKGNPRQTHCAKAVARVFTVAGMILWCTRGMCIIGLKALVESPRRIEKFSTRKIRLGVALCGNSSWSETKTDTALNLGNKSVLEKRYNCLPTVICLLLSSSNYSDATVILSP
jgi:hypothetical protein